MFFFPHKQSYPSFKTEFKDHSSISPSRTSEAGSNCPLLWLLKRHIIRGKFNVCTCLRTFYLHFSFGNEHLNSITVLYSYLKSLTNCKYLIHPYLYLPQYLDQIWYILHGFTEQLMNKCYTKACIPKESMPLSVLLRQSLALKKTKSRNIFQVFNRKYDKT